MSVPLWLMPLLWALAVYAIVLVGSTWRRRLRRERREGRRQALRWINPE